MSRIRMFRTMLLFYLPGLIIRDIFGICLRFLIILVINVIGLVRELEVRFFRKLTQLLSNNTEQDKMFLQTSYNLSQNYIIIYITNP